MLSLTSSLFRDALARHVDASKPDPLARRQIDSLRLGWEPRRRREQGLGRDGSPSRPPPEGAARRRRRTTAIPHEDAAEPDDDDDDDDDDWKWVCGGTLTMSSDYISISIGVDCECRTTSTMAPAGKSDGKSFGDEFYFRLSVSADFASSSPAAAGDAVAVCGDEPAGDGAVHDGGGVYQRVHHGDPHGGHYWRSAVFVGIRSGSSSLIKLPRPPVGGFPPN